MVLRLDTIQPKKGARKSKKRIGRGLSKGGAFSGRGTKGQRSRSGGKSGLKLKGLRKIMLSTPKTRGFKSSKPTPEVVNVSGIAKNFADGAKVTPEHLLKKNLVSKIRNGVKVLGNGEITIKVTVTDCKVSQSAKEKIEKAGGTVIVNK